MHRPIWDGRRLGIGLERALYVGMFPKPKTARLALQPDSECPSSHLLATTINVTVGKDHYGAGR
jgi:hypothetical protein